MIQELENEAVAPRYDGPSGAQHRPRRAATAAAARIYKEKAATAADVVGWALDGLAHMEGDEASWDWPKIASTAIDSERRRPRDKRSVAFAEAPFLLLGGKR